LWRDQRRGGRWRCGCGADGDKYEDWPDDYENPKEVQDLINIATDLKAIGNEYFKKGEYHAAVKKYAKAIRYLDEKDPLDDKLNFYAVKIPCYLNKAASLLKLGDYAGTVDDTTVVIDLSEEFVTPVDRAKARFRRGSARLNLKDETEAEKDLEIALELSPQDAAIKRELALVRQRIAQRKQKEKAAFSKMFS